MTTIYFTKRFLTGLLKGLSYKTSITFDTARLAKMAKAYRRGAHGSDCLTGTKWIITDASFQSYTPLTNAL